MILAEAQPVVEPPFCCYGAVFGSIGGLIVLIILILVVRHCTKKNEGEGYNGMYCRSVIRKQFYAFLIIDYKFNISNNVLIMDL